MEREKITEIYKKGYTYTLTISRFTELDTFLINLLFEKRVETGNRVKMVMT